MARAGELSVDWLIYAHHQVPPLSERLRGLAGVPKLFLQPADEHELGDSTRQLFTKSPEPRELVVLAHGNYVSLPEEEKRSYENRVVTFFLLRLPPSARPIK